MKRAAYGFLSMAILAAGGVGAPRSAQAIDVQVLRELVDESGSLASMSSDEYLAALTNRKSVEFQTIESIRAKLMSAWMSGDAKERDPSEPLIPELYARGTLLQQLMLEAMATAEDAAKCGVYARAGAAMTFLLPYAPTSRDYSDQYYYPRQHTVPPAGRPAGIEIGNALLYFVHNLYNVRNCVVSRTFNRLWDLRWVRGISYSTDHNRAGYRTYMDHLTGRWRESESYAIYAGEVGGRFSRDLEEKPVHEVGWITHRAIERDALETDAAVIALWKKRVTLK